MQDKFLTFSGNFCQLMNNMSNMSQTSEVMNVECFSALTRNVGKLHEMKKAHEDMAMEIAVLKLEKAEALQAKKALEESGNAQNLRKENIELFKENERLKSELESTQKLLADVRKSSKERADKDAESIRLLQDSLEARLVEIKAVDDDLLCHYICDRPTNENMTTLIKELGELIIEFSKASRHFVKKLYPAKDSEKIFVEEISELMCEVANKQTERLQSAGRGGARTALALMLAHYRTAKPARLASGFPSTVTEEETAKLFTEVSGYATRIAEMVKEETYFEAVPCPEILEVFSDEESTDEDK